MAMIEAAKAETEQEPIGQVGDHARPPAKRTFANISTRLVLGILMAVMLLLAGGYGLFRMEIATLRDAATPDSADGIVVLTGDVGRIRKGIELFDNGIGKRILISGVHQKVPRENVLKLANASSQKAACCVDLGRLALDTRGNATETETWVAKHGFQTIALITSDYHMPRGLLELKTRLPDIKFLPVAVSVNGPDPGRAERSFLRHSLREYGKFLASHARLKWFAFVE